MPNTVQRAFSSGELTPSLYARTDFAKYISGLRTCRNFQVKRTGGVENRQGTEFCAPTPGNGVTRLVKFVFNTEQAFVMEFSASFIRFYRGGALVGPTLTSPYAVTDLFDLHFAQSGDVVAITHPSYSPRELKRLAADGSSWSLTEIVFGPLIGTPQNVAMTGTGGLIPYEYWVTAIDAITGEESLAGHFGPHAVTTPNATNPHTVTWDPVTNAGSYRVFRRATFQEASMGFIGSTISNTFKNSGIAPDFATQVPVARPLFNSVNNYPAEVGYFQQRRIFANTNSNPEGIWTSKTGNYYNFLTSTPLVDDDAVTFALAGKEVNAVRFLINMAKLLIFTEGGEWLVEGDNAGVLTPSGINTRVGSYNGCGKMAPILVDSNMLYVQALGNRVLELRTNVMYGYFTFQGLDHTLLSSHLLDGYTLVDWDWQQVPNYTVWSIRSDGTLLGFTYVAAEQLAAWHRHDTDGAFESVCVIPEGGEHRVYVVVRRTVNGKTVRYVERFLPRLISDITTDAGFMDANAVYDGRKAGNVGRTLTLTGGVNWTYDELLTLTCSRDEFILSNVGDQRVLRDVAGDEIRFTIAGFTDARTVTGFSDLTVPVGLRGTTLTDWDRAVRAVAGLDYLEGKAVSIFADGFVVASPNNPDYEQFVVTVGQVTLDSPRAYIRVGLPFVSDLQTLDIDTAEGPSLKERFMNVTALGAFVEASRGIWLGTEPPGDDGLANLQEVKIRRLEDWTEPVSLVTDYVEMTVPSRWNNNGRVFLRQVDPVPLTVLSLTPLGFIPKGGKS